MCSNSPSHMTSITTRPLYGKNMLKSLPWHFEGKVNVVKFAIRVFMWEEFMDFVEI